jgi:hypothetical protein
MQSVSITIKVVILNPAHGEVYSIKFVLNLQFSPVPPSIKLTAMIWLMVNGEMLINIFSESTDGIHTVHRLLLNNKLMIYD